jgi:hypothetical protein
MKLSKSDLMQLIKEQRRACAPAIAESKDYKRLAKKWLSEGKKISAEKFRGLWRPEES